MTYTPEERRKAADALMSDKDSRIRVDVDRYLTLQCHVNALRKALEERLQNDMCLCYLMSDIEKPCAFCDDTELLARVRSTVSMEHAEKLCVEQRQKWLREPPINCRKHRKACKP